jgi:hypothetical protein
MIVTTECRQLLHEVRAEMAPVAAYVAETEKQLRSLAMRTDLGEGFAKLVKGDLASQRQLTSSVAAAHRLLAKIDDDLFAIETGHRRPAAGRRPDIVPFFEDDDDAEAFKQPGRTIH